MRSTAALLAVSHMPNHPLPTSTSTASPIQPLSPRFNFPRETLSPLSSNPQTATPTYSADDEDSLLESGLPAANKWEGTEKFFSKFLNACGELRERIQGEKGEKGKEGSRLQRRWRERNGRERGQRECIGEGVEEGNQGKGERSGDGNGDGNDERGGGDEAVDSLLRAAAREIERNRRESSDREASIARPREERKARVWRPALMRRR
ncbi:MAG: hypothetical protein M1820_002682 [Bogoriella megaspora]|nr:MAG: hypothetical protein M1820_002682 [Bogoriella megaspora]